MAPRRRPRRPASTIRLRLTLIYGITFLLTGAVLLSIGYLLVRHNLDTRPKVAFQDRARLLPLLQGFRRFPFAPGSPAARVAEEVRSQLRAATLHRLAIEYAAALLAMTLISGVAGWLLAGRALAPLRRITATARRVSGENLGERIDLAGPADELKELADTFDGMLGRLDRAFSSQRHFVAKASHELRTPLAIMRTEIDVALADEDASIGELRAMGDALRATIDRCERLIEGLLMLARSEAAGGKAQALDLAALAADCITDDSARARQAQIRVSSELEPAPAVGERTLLERTIANLVENGIRHNHPGGWLTICTGTVDGAAQVLVRNGGPRIDPALTAELTEPFRRLDPARDGFGLGLSIVRSVVEAHGGRLRLHAPPEGGLEVEVRLPSTHQLPAAGLRGADGEAATTVVHD